MLTNALTIGGVIREFQSRFPEFAARLVDEKGTIRRFVHFYVNEEDIRFLREQETPIDDGDVIYIIPPICG